MALTNEQWTQKLKRFVPSWWFEDDDVTEALFYAIGAVFAGIDEDNDDQFNQIFLTRATAPLLDLMGSERSITRLAGESDSDYALRIQRITSQTDLPEIKAVIDSLLAVPGCKILEAPMGSPYCSRGNFLSRDDYTSSFRNNFFTVVVPMQIHAPYNFLSRAAFASRLGFVGTVESETDFYSSIIAAVNAQKAFGVLWRLEESHYSTVV